MGIDHDSSFELLLQHTLRTYGTALPTSHDHLASGLERSGSLGRSVDRLDNVLGADLYFSPRAGGSDARRRRSAPRRRRRPWPVRSLSSSRQVAHGARAAPPQLLCGRARVPFCCAQRAADRLRRRAAALLRAWADRMRSRAARAAFWGYLLCLMVG